MSVEIYLFFWHINNMRKEKQLKIILKYNPCPDEYHTWIRTVNDIKTLAEALLDDDYAGYDTFDPDYTRADAERALKTRQIVVYSSHPITQGVFVTPSKMEATDYTADGKVYSKLVNIDDLAWIDVTQGQYANVSLEEKEN